MSDDEVATVAGSFVSPNTRT